MVCVVPIYTAVKRRLVYGSSCLISGRGNYPNALASCRNVGRPNLYTTTTTTTQSGWCTEALVSILVRSQSRRSRPGGRCVQKIDLPRSKGYITHKHYDNTSYVYQHNKQTREQPTHTKCTRNKQHTYVCICICVYIYITNNNNANDNSSNNQTQPNLFAQLSDPALPDAYNANTCTIGSRAPALPQ